MSKQIKETDLKQFGLLELDYILFLDNQLYDNLNEMQERLLSLDYDDEIKRVINYIDNMMTDTTEHAIKVKEAKDWILKDMEREQQDALEDCMEFNGGSVKCKNCMLVECPYSATNNECSSRPTTPCEYPDNNGLFSCPWDAIGPDDCRNFCGLGVDE